MGEPEQAAPVEPEPEEDTPPGAAALRVELSGMRVGALKKRIARSTARSHRVRVLTRIDAIHICGKQSVDGKFCFTIGLHSLKWN